MLAPAKINLLLHVLGKRQDGYHDLQSLAVFAEEGDVLRAELADDLSLAVTGPFAPALTGDNLVLSAAKLLAPEKGAAIVLEKNLPVGSGLGGGSADAAAALKLLNELWGLSHACEALQAQAAALGSDVPVCLESKTCMMEGRGERLKPVEMRFSLPIVLVNPRLPLSTRDVFARIAPPFRPRMEIPIRFSDQASLISWLRQTGNDLEAPAISLMPGIAECLSALKAVPGCLLFRMSGSGATCFGVFSTEKEAAFAAARLSAANRSWWVRATRTLHADQA